MAFRLKISTREDGSFDAYIASGNGASRPALLICPEVFGVNSHMRSLADRFAQQGYLAVVPDLYWRVEPGLELPYDEAGLKRGSEILAQIDAELATQDLGLVMDAVRKLPDCNGKIGVLGFCIGGTIAYLAAARLGADAAVGYYAKGVENFLEEARGISCGLVLHYGGADRFIPPSVVAEVREATQGMANVEVYDYPGVDHGFNSEDRKAYNPEVAAIAMQRTLALLETSLKQNGHEVPGNLPLGSR